MSFITSDHAERRTDVIYEAKVKGHPVIFYILLELQSRVDYRMPFRLLEYIFETLREYYKRADVDERDNKDFKFPAVIPLVFYSGSDTWTVPLSAKQMFDGYEYFGSHVLNFDYTLIDAKQFTDADLQTFSSRLLAVAMVLEKSQNKVEFLNNFRKSLDDASTFDAEERRVFIAIIDIMNIAFGFDSKNEIENMLRQNQVKEVDGMLCDAIQNAMKEKEIYKIEGKLEDAITMLLDNVPIVTIIKYTGLPREEIEKIKLDKPEASTAGKKAD
jgi:predicted transposase/invertase (TIGR01784 family)